MEQDNNLYKDLDSIAKHQEVKTQEEKSREEKSQEEKRALGKNRFILGLAYGVLIASILFGGAVLVLNAVWVKRVKEHRLEEQQLQQEQKTNLVEIPEGNAVTSDLISKMQALEFLIDQNFYLEGNEDEALQNGAYKGMIDGLKDPYSVYYTAEEFEELINKTEGIYYGIGAYLTLEPETKLPMIVSVIPHTPAEESELRENDVIYEIDGVSPIGLTLTEATKLIKGEEGTTVQLSILRGEDTFDVTVERRKVDSPTVDSKMLEDGMGYLTIYEFDEVTSGQFQEAYQQLYEQGMKGLILDVRANPGGNLDVVVDICRMLLPKGLVVYTQNKQGKRIDYTCDGRNEIQIPMVVLVDMNSASAAEILAGAIQDHKKGTLIGTTTFGKGIVQSLYPLKDGSAVKLTTSSYFTPNGRNIHGLGIEPDIICEFDGETYYNSNREIDNQLNKAKEVLLSMIK